MLRIISFLSFFGWKPDPAQYNLLQSNQVEWSTHPDGKSRPPTGRYTEVFLYRNNPVFVDTWVYRNGDCVTHQPHGNEHFRDIVLAGSLFGHVRYVTKAVTRADSHTHVRRNVKNVPLSVYRTLMNHPQYRKFLVRALEHGWRVSVDPNGYDTYRINVEKV